MFPTSMLSLVKSSYCFKPIIWVQPILCIVRMPNGTGLHLTKICAVFKIVIWGRGNHSLKADHRSIYQETECTLLLSIFLFLLAVGVYVGVSVLVVYVNVCLLLLEEEQNAQMLCVCAPQISSFLENVCLSLGLCIAPAMNL